MSETPKRYRRWTYDERLLLEQLKKEGVALAEIAERLGRTPKAVRMMLYQPTCSPDKVSKQITPQQEQWLVKHYKHTPNAEIMEKFSISYSMLHRAVRALGLRKSKQFMRKTVLYASEQAKKSHLANGTYPPKGYVIPNRHKFPKGVSSRELLGEKRYKEVLAKAAETRRKTWKSERARATFGFEQKTKLRVIRQPKAKICLRLNLRKSGYIQDPNDRNLFYYPNEEMRSAIREKNGKVYNLKFLPLNNP